MGFQVWNCLVFFSKHKLQLRALHIFRLKVPWLWEVFKSWQMAIMFSIHTAVESNADWWFLEVTDVEWETDRFISYHIGFIFCGPKVSKGVSYLSEQRVAENMSPTAVLLAVTAMYSIQGCIHGLSDSTIPQLLNRKEATLQASEVLAIVHLPAALKIFFAPLVDYGAQNIPGGYKNLVIALQGLLVASLMTLIPLLPEVLQLGGRLGAERLRWPFFGVALLNALGDLILDAFALRQLPAHQQHLPSVCQVIGLFVGTTAAKSGLFLLMKLEVLSLEGLLASFVGSMAVIALLAVLAVALASKADRNTEVVHFRDVLSGFWIFTTHRPNMAHWLLYQFFMPAVNFHHTTVLANRYEQRGFHGEDYATFDLPLAVLTLGILVLASKVADDANKQLSWVMKGYCCEALLVLCLVAQYCTWAGTPTTSFKVIYVVLNKFHDISFFVCDMLEFAFMGQVANLEPKLVATLITLQASAFNFSGFFYSWLAPTLVDRLSSCSRDEKLSCDYDAYPLVGVALTMVTLVFLISQWKRISTYQDVTCCGWQHKDNPLRRQKLVVGMVLGGISVFTWKEVMLMQWSRRP